ncbi:MAG: hypothetical protein GY906_37045 [bacterium]|nr:hypothetical protein [bacterium]
MATPEERVQQALDRLAAGEGAQPPSNLVEESLLRLEGPIVGRRPEAVSVSQEGLAKLGAFQAREQELQAFPDVQRGVKESFVRGVRSGATLPLRFAGVQGPAELARIRDRPLPRILGEFAGVTVPFLVLDIAAGVGLGATGLATTLSPTSQALIRGAIAGNIVELGATDEMSRGTLPERIVLGTLIGAAADAGMVRLFGRIGARTGEATRATATPERPLNINMETAASLDPTAYRMSQEASIDAGRTPQNKINRIAAIDENPPAATLPDILQKQARYSQVYGSVELLGLKKREFMTFQRKLKELAGSERYEFMSRQNPDTGLVDVMVLDGFFRSNLETALGTKEQWSTYGKFLGEGDQRASVQEILSLLSLKTPGEASRLTGVGILPRTEAVGAAAIIDTSRGFGSEIRIREGTINEGGLAVSALVHEYMHDLMLVATKRSPLRFKLTQDKVSALTRSETADDQFGLVAELFGFDDPKLVSSLIGDVGPDGIRKSGELLRATEEMVGRHQFAAAGREQLFRKGRSVQIAETARSAVREAINGNLDYYLRDTELISRLAELMLLDPEVALKVAPRATRALGKVISENSPKLRLLFTDEFALPQRLSSNMADLMEAQGKASGFVVENLPRGSVQGEAVRPTTQQRAQYFNRGFFDGQDVIFRGEGWRVTEVLPSQTLGGEVGLKIFNPRTGRSLPVVGSGVTKPTFARAARIQEQVVRAVMQMAEKPPSMFKLNVLDPATGVVEARWHFVENLLVRNADELGGSIDEALEAARAAGKTGVLLNDEGIVKIISREGQVGEGVAPATVRRVHGTTNDQVFTLDHRDIVESQLLSAGVPQREVEFFGRLVEDSEYKSALRVMEPDLRNAIENVFAGEQRGFKKFVELKKTLDADLTDIGERMGYNIDYETDGVYRLVDPNGQEFNFETRDDLRAFLENFGNEAHVQDLRELDPYAPEVALRYGSLQDTGVSPVTESAFDGLSGTISTRPLRYTETPMSRALDLPPEAATRKLSDIFFPAIATGLANWTRRVQDQLRLPTATVFDAAQGAIKNIEAFRNLPDAGLGKVRGGALRRAAEKTKVGRDRTLNNAMRDFFSDVKLMPPERRKLITKYLGAFSKEELLDPLRTPLVNFDDQGNIVRRGLNADELRVAAAFSRFGIIYDVADRVGDWSSLNGWVKNKKARLVQAEFELTNNPRLTQADRAFYTNLVAARNQKWTPELIAQAQGMPATKVAKIRAVALALQAEDVNLVNVSRFMGAKASRSQFAKKARMTPKEIDIAREMETILVSTYNRTGAAPEGALRHLAVTIPELRRFVKAGMTPDAPIIKRYLGPDGTYLAGKLSTGELDVYIDSPTHLTFRMTRARMFNRFFDDIHEKIIKPGLDVIAADPVHGDRTSRIMRRYIDELRGDPHPSTKVVQKWLQATLGRLGMNFSEDATQEMLGLITATTYTATIPFRAGLLIRNIFETLRIVPRMGATDTAGALHFMLDPSTSRLAWEQARAAGAVTDVLPVFQGEIVSTENLARSELGKRIFGTAFGDKISSAFGAYRTKVRGGISAAQDIRDIGFNLYQTGDNVARVVAFHTMRRRVSRHIGDLQQGKITRPEFERKTSLLTFSDVDRDNFFQLLNTTGPQQATDYIATQFSHETLFRYGHANHPAGWGSVPGRLFGQFGTWPVQYKDWMIQGLTRGSGRDRARFAFWNFAVGGATAGVAAEQGVDMRPWIAWSSQPLYTGGPYFDITIDVARVISGSPQERRLAWLGLSNQFAPIRDPSTIWIPGSYAVNDMYRFWSGEGGFEEVLGLKAYNDPSRQSRVLEALRTPFR